ncbi:hypothetical protein GF323_01095 [Candidatus Woesearchaeota archaeon]|nr:hypothetical protein [Candidatus Woesearchaeota archaeon]
MGVAELEMEVKNGFRGLGLGHGDARNPNWEAQKWALGRLRVLREHYRRLVIERDPIDLRFFTCPYFRSIASEAEIMGYHVIREPEDGVKENYDKVRIYLGVKGLMDPEEFRPDEEVLERAKIDCYIAALRRSRNIARCAFQEEGSIIVAGSWHVIHAQDREAHSAGVDFNAEYNPDVSGSMRLDANSFWNQHNQKLD